MTAPEIVERALSSRSLDGMTVICQENSQTNLRWAANTLTTNGVMRSCDVTVIAMQDRADGVSVGVASASVAELDDVTDVVKRAEDAARSADKAPDSADLIAGNADSNFGDAPDETSPIVFEEFAPALGRWFAEAQRDDIELFGYAEHSLTTTYLGNSAGLRRRYVQPAGRIEVTGKSASRTRSTWAGRATRDFRDI